LQAKLEAEYAALQRTTLAQFPEVLPEDVVTFEAFRYGRDSAKFIIQCLTGCVSEG
jgi:hypothetical protein